MIGYCLFFSRGCAYIYLHNDDLKLTYKEVNSKAS